VTEEVLRTLPATRLFADGVLLVAGVSHRPDVEPALLRGILVACAEGLTLNDLGARLSGQVSAADLERVTRALRRIGALYCGAPKSHDRLDSLAVVPQHSGVWEGQWHISDPSGALIDRFEGTLRCYVQDNAWRNELQQRFGDREVHQTFVGEVIAPGVLELKSETDLMMSHRLIAYEVANSHVLIEVTERESGTLFGVEIVVLHAPDLRTRTMQTFAPDGELRGVATIRERRVGSV